MLVVGASWFFQERLFASPLSNVEEVVDNKCLNEGEEVRYEFTRGKNTGDSVTIFVVDKKSKDIKKQFGFFVLSASHYHPIEIYKCRVYAVRSFGYDYIKKITLENYKNELWAYDYAGVGKSVMTSYAKWSHENILGDFRISPPEQYIALRKGYGGRDDYSLVIKDLNTLKAAFVLPVADIIKQNPDVVGDVSFENGGWSTDGRYFWAGMSVGAEIYGFVRIDSKNWSFEAFTAPQVTMGGDALNINTGIVTYGADVAPWSGVVEIDEQLRKEAAQTGQISSFYIYNLLTKQKYLVATTTDPTYYFRPEWLSDTELQYELPSGEKKIYKTNEK